MSPQPLQSLRQMSLHFFEEMFEPFIDQSRNISIRYQIQKEKTEDPNTFTIIVCSVNDATTPEDFHRKLTALTDVSLQQVDVFLQQQNPAHIDAQVDYILGKLDALGRIVVDESYLLQDELEGGFRHCPVKSFIKSRLEGPNIGDWSILGPVVHYKTQKFTEVWLQVINNTKDQVNLIRNIYKSTCLTKTTESSQCKPDSDNFKIKFKISIDQEAYFFYLLVKSEIIDVPNRKSPQLLNWMTHNLQSKNCKSNSLTSVRNKYFYHQLATLDYWYQKLLDALEFINEERERILKYIPQ